MTFRVFSSSLSRSFVSTVRQIIAPFLFDAYEYVTSQPLAAAHPPSIGAYLARYQVHYVYQSKTSRADWAAACAQRLHMNGVQYQRRIRVRRAEAGTGRRIHSGGRRRDERRHDRRRIIAVSTS